MKLLFSNRRSDRKAFSLIELLIVVAIIAILAAMLIPITNRISIARMKSVARAELNQVATAIDHYKGKQGFYPPDNPTNALYSPLYYELVGTLLTNLSTAPNYITLDGSSQVLTSAVFAVLNVGGFANSSTSGTGNDDRPAPVRFLKDLKPAHIGFRTNSGSVAAILLCSQEWAKPGASSTETLNPWRYNSSNPTNNPGAYDLWVDLYIDGKTNRISNWSKQPQIVW